MEILEAFRPTLADGWVLSSIYLPVWIDLLKTSSIRDPAYRKCRNSSVVARTDEKWSSDKTNNLNRFFREQTVRIWCVPNLVHTTGSKNISGDPNHRLRKKCSPSPSLFVNAYNLQLLLGEQLSPNSTSCFRYSALLHWLMHICNGYANSFNEERYALFRVVMRML
jgi:hypothetical protein